MVAFIRKPVREWLDEHENRIEALEQGGVPPGGATEEYVDEQIAEARSYTDARIAATRKHLDLREFTVNHAELTNENFHAAFNAAKAAAYAAGTSTSCYDLYIPKCDITLSESLTLPPPGVAYSPAPGLIGAGKMQTVLRKPTAATWAAIILGDPTFTTTADFLFQQEIGGFSLRGGAGRGADARGDGIVSYSALYQWFHDIEVRGFDNINNDYTAGRGFKFIGVADGNHQHLLMERCLVEECIVGFDFYLVYPARIVHCGSHGNRWLQGVFSRSEISWEGTDWQFSQQPDSAAWWSGINSPGWVSGFDYTTELGSGAGASISAASGGLSTVTGLTGVTEDHSGRWFRRAGVEMFKIHDVLSSTSLRIRRGVGGSLSSQVWQICSHQGGNNLTFTGNGYDEASGGKLATFGFYKDETGSSNYSLQNASITGAQYQVECDGVVGKVVMDNVERTFNEDVAKIRRTHQFYAPQAYHAKLNYDSFSYPGIVARAHEADGILHLRDGGGVGAAGIRDALEKMGAIEIWHTDVTSRVIRTGADVTSWQGVLHGTALNPQHASKYPQWDTSDTTFGSPCILLGGTDGATRGQLTGTINAAHVPQNRAYKTTLVVVARLLSTTPGGGTRRVKVQDTANARNVELLVNDNTWFTQPWGVTRFADNGDGAPAGRAVRFPIDAVDADLNPHVFVVGGVGRHLTLGYLSSDYHSSDYVSGSGDADDITANSFQGLHPAATSLTVDLGLRQDPTVGEWKIALVAVLDHAATKAEHRQIVDLCRRRWLNMFQ